MFELDAVPCPLIRLRRELVIVEVNRRAAELLGISPAEALGRPIETLLPGYCPPDEESELRLLLKRPDSAPVPVGVQVQSLDDGGVLLALQEFSRTVQAERSLERSEDRWVHAERLAQLGTWEWSPAHDELVWSSETYRLLEIDPNTLPEPSFRDLMGKVHPDDRERVMSEMQSEVESGGLAPVEYRIVRSDGVRFVRGLATTLEDEDGQPRVYGFVQDISDAVDARKRLAEQAREKEVLLREIHHRVKNNLQVISSMLSLEADSAESSAAAPLRATRDRVIAMGIVHDMLYSGASLSQVDLGAYLERLTSSLMVSNRLPGHEVELDVVSEGATVDIETAILCGLMVNELVTNALKHAFVGRGRGTIRVTHERLNDSRSRLAVCDDGVGLPADAKDGLGMEIVRILGTQLGATVAVETHSGVRCSLEFSNAS